MRPSARWTVGIITFAIGLGIFITPEDPDHPKWPIAYAFSAYLIFCSSICAFPSTIGFRLVSAATSMLSLGIATFWITQLANHSARMGTPKQVEGIVITAMIGIGTAWYTVSGRLPKWLWLLAHKWPPSDDDKSS